MTTGLFLPLPPLGKIESDKRLGKAADGRSGRSLIGLDSQPITTCRYNDATLAEESGNLMKNRFGDSQRSLSGKQYAFDVSVRPCCQNPTERRLKERKDRKKWFGWQPVQTSTQALVK